MPPNSVTDGREAGAVAHPAASSDRRKFLQWSGAAAALFALACDSPTDPDGSSATEVPAPEALRKAAVGESVKLGSGDLGILNYAFALEQLEAEFYRLVAEDFYPGSSQLERQTLRDIKRHELVHRDFYMAALGSNGIPRLNFDFSSVDFRNRLSVLKAAKRFEDLGVEAYNGAAHLIKDTTTLFVAGKIVSVEARHASAIRDLINPKSPDFAPRAFDRAKSPSEVLAIAAPFFKNKLIADHLPTA